MSDEKVTVTISNGGPRNEARVRVPGSHMLRTARLDDIRPTPTGAIVEASPGRGRELVDALCGALRYYPTDPRVEAGRAAVRDLAAERRHLTAVAEPEHGPEYYEALREGVRRYAWWKATAPGQPGVQVVGQGNITLARALDGIDAAERADRGAVAG